jgi:hypothetical protein
MDILSNSELVKLFDHAAYGQTSSEEFRKSLERYKYY